MTSMIAPATPMAAYRDAAGMSYLTQNADQFPREVLNRMIALDPDQYRLLTILDVYGKAGRTKLNTRAPEVTEHPYKYEWYGNAPSATYIELTATCAVGDATITVSAADAKRVTNFQNLICSESGESLRVKLASADAFPSSTTIGVLRSVGGTPAQEMAAGTRLFLSAASRTEASADPTPTGFVPQVFYNYTGEYSKSAGATMKMMTSKQYAGWSPSQDQKLCMNDFRRELEFEALLGELEYQTASDGYIVTRTNGLFRSFSTNVVTTTAVPDWWGFCDQIWPYLRYGGGGLNGRKVKHIFCSMSWARWFDMLPGDRWTVNDPHKMMISDIDDGFRWGWQIREVVVSGVRLVIHPMPWFDDWSGSALNLAQSLVVLDSYEVGLRYRPGGRPALLPSTAGKNGRAPVNTTNEIVCYRADFGVQQTWEQSGGIWTCRGL